MSLSEGLHVERTEFLGTGQSNDGQKLMNDYIAATDSIGELPALPRGHLRASARLGPGARARLDQRGGEP